MVLRVLSIAQLTFYIHQKRLCKSQVSVLSNKIFFEIQTSSLASVSKENFTKITRFSTISNFSIQRLPLVFQKKKVYRMFQRKKSCSEILPSNTSMLESFFSTLAGLPGLSLVEFSKKLVKNSYTVENMLAHTYIKTNSTADVIAGIFSNFKNMQGFKAANSW